MDLSAAGQHDDQSFDAHADSHDRRDQRRRAEEQDAHMHHGSLPIVGAPRITRADIVDDVREFGGDIMSVVAPGVPQS